MCPQDRVTNEVFSHCSYNTRVCSCRLQWAFGLFNVLKAFSDPSHPNAPLRRVDLAPWPAGARRARLRALPRQRGCRRREGERGEREEQKTDQTIGQGSGSLWTAQWPEIGRILSKLLVLFAYPSFLRRCCMVFVFRECLATYILLSLGCDFLKLDWESCQ